VQVKRFVAALAPLALSSCAPTEVETTPDWRVIGFLDQVRGNGPAVSFIDAASVKKIDANRRTFVTQQYFGKSTKGREFATRLRAKNRVDCSNQIVSVLEVTEWREGEVVETTNRPGPQQWVGPGWTILQAMRAVCKGDFAKLDPVAASALDKHAADLIRSRAAMHQSISGTGWVISSEDDAPAPDEREISLVDRNSVRALPNGHQFEFTLARIAQKAAEGDGAVLYVFRHQIDCRAGSVTMLLAQEFGASGEPLIDVVPVRRSSVTILPNTPPARTLHEICDKDWSRTFAVVKPLKVLRSLIFDPKTAKLALRSSE
jgi:hypothetical protein